MKTTKVQSAQVVQLVLSDEMKLYFDQMCDYRRYIWNKALALWQDLYKAHTIFDEVYKYEFSPVIDKKTGKVKSVKEKQYHRNPSPTWQSVKAMLVDSKEDWEDLRSSRTLQLACKDLGETWSRLFDKSSVNAKMPKFKSKRAPRQGFKSDRIRIEKGKLVLDQPRGLKKYLKDNNLNWWQSIQTTEPLKMERAQTVSFFKEKGKYLAAIAYQKEVQPKAKTGKANGIDVNTSHYNDVEGIHYLFSKRLLYCYHEIADCQRRLARKRRVNGKIKAQRSNNYVKTKNKLNYWYERAKHIQVDWLQKYTTKLVDNYDRIVIEDLNVAGMKMGIASKSVHRAMFGRFRQILTYKCAWYGRELIVADRWYPSTQRCANCGFVKTGDEKITLYGNQKHNTKHNEYICYNCGYQNDRDVNAMLNLVYLVIDDEQMRQLLKNNK